MLRANQYWFYDLGSKIHPLTQIQEGVTVSGVFWPLWEARRDLDSTYIHFPLRVSNNAAIALYRAITQVLPTDFGDALKANATDTLLEFRQAYDIRQAATAFETVLSAELQVMDTYLVSQKGTYSTPDLIDRGDLMIPASLRADMPAQAITDLQAAGRCLAFNVPTATAFHILRASESVIRMYYQQVTGSLPKPKMRNWGTYVKNLNVAGADLKITGFIDHLRDLYRNPILHAEDNLSAEDALVFVGACVSLMCKIIMETKRLRSVAERDAEQVAISEAGQETLVPIEVLRPAIEAPSPDAGTLKGGTVKE
jgi:hypothetical protein